MATTEYMLVGKDFGLTLSIPKTKVMAVEREVMTEGRTPLKVGGEEIEAVSEFPYLGSQIESYDVGCRKADCTGIQSIWST